MRKILFYYVFFFNVLMFHSACSNNVDKKKEKTIQDVHNALENIRISDGIVTQTGFEVLKNIALEFEKNGKVSDYDFSFLKQMISVYIYLGNYDKAILMQENIIKRRNNPEELLFLACLQEKNMQFEQAVEKYKIVLKMYDLRLNKDSSVFNQINKAFVLLLINENDGIKAFDSLMMQYPNDDYVRMMKNDMCDNFNRKRIINAFVLGIGKGEIKVYTFHK